MTGYVYAIRAEDRVKIGWSSNPAGRLVKVQTDNPHPCVLVGAILATQEQERELHQLLSPWRTGGEWFDISGLPVRRFCEMLPAFVEPQAGIPDDAHPLVHYRRSSGLDQKSLAILLGTSCGTLCDIEKRRKNPSPVLARHIEVLTGVSRHLLRPDVYGDALQ